MKSLVEILKDENEYCFVDLCEHYIWIFSVEMAPGSRSRKYEVCLDTKNKTVNIEYHGYRVADEYKINESDFYLLCNLALQRYERDGETSRKFVQDFLFSGIE